MTHQTLIYDYWSEIVLLHKLGINGKSMLCKRGSTQNVAPSKDGVFRPGFSNSLMLSSSGSLILLRATTSMLKQASSLQTRTVHFIQGGWYPLHLEECGCTMHQE